MEYDSGFGMRRTQRQFDARAGVQANAGRLDFGFERALFHHRYPLFGPGSDSPAGSRS
jgi:hypothetical protein